MCFVSIKKLFLSSWTDNSQPAFYGFNCFCSLKTMNAFLNKPSLVVWLHCFLKWYKLNHLSECWFVLVDILWWEGEIRVSRRRNFAGFKAVSLRMSSGPWPPWSLLEAKLLCTFSMYSSVTRRRVQGAVVYLSPTIYNTEERKVTMSGGILKV